MKLVHVYIEHTAVALNRCFVYNGDGFALQRGVRVRVPFAHRKVIGFVDHIEENDPSIYPYDILKILEVIDETPLISEELFLLAKDMEKRCVTSLIGCLQCMLPNQLRPKSNYQKVRMEAYVRAIKKDCQLLTKRQKEVYEELCQQDFKRSVYYAQFKSVGKKLIEMGYAQVYEKEMIRRLTTFQKQEPNPLTQLQQKALDMILNPNHQYLLLHGVTGSGKTEVFLQCAAQVIASGKQVLILVPEIALTPQMIQRVSSRFERVAIYHSHLNEQEKYEQYQLVKQGKVDIVVGTRSAIFMPFQQLGLIVMDEEHDNSYKQDRSPCYHCRDVALFRANYHHAKLVLASATPSLESYARAIKKHYVLVEMLERINQCMPDIKIVEMRQALRNNESYLLSKALCQAIEERLLRKEQVILLLNRRGYAPILRCLSCGYVHQCPHCDCAMSFHKEDGIMKCHVCGFEMAQPHYCPSCYQQAWRYIGIGTQKLEEFVSSCFPSAKILRMDADTTSRKHAHEVLLERFGSKQADILIGTQMIAKGLDFENVTLVGIVNGDAMLNRNDYRSCELTYHLLQQASGRSGRGQKKGEVYIQCYDSSHYAIEAVLKNDYLHFFINEMKYRHLGGYPPYRYLCSLLLRGGSEAELQIEAQKMKSMLVEYSGNVRILGPVELGKQKNEYRIRILLKSKSENDLMVVAQNARAYHLNHKLKGTLDIDMNPYIID